MDQDAGSGGRFDVVSPDGTSIAVWVEGRGPALVLVHGSIADHTTFDPFVAVLGQQVTTFSMDRRGFGASEDQRLYAVEREFDDVAAVVEAVARRTVGRVALWGHSYGANCAMGGAARTDQVRHLILYEPSLGLRYEPGVIDRIEAAVDAGDPEMAIVTVLREVLELSEDDIDQMKSGPIWPVRLAAAPTVPRECRAEEDWVYRPGQFESITAATLFLGGSESVPTMVEATRLAMAAVPNAQLRVLPGHAHMAHKTDPQLVTNIVMEFCAR